MSANEITKYASNCDGCGLMKIRRYGVRPTLSRLPERLFNRAEPDVPTQFGAEFDEVYFDDAVFGIAGITEPTPQYELARIMAKERDLFVHGIRQAVALQLGMGDLALADAGHVRGECFHAQGVDLDRVGEQFGIGRPANFSDCCYWRLIQTMIFTPGSAGVPKLLELATLYTGDCPRVVEEPNKIILVWPTLEWESFYNYQSFYDQAFAEGSGEVVAFGLTNAVDGETFIVTALDGPASSITVTFEFDDNSSVGGGNIAVEIGATAADTAIALADAINAAMPGIISASANPDIGRITMSSSWTLILGNFNSLLTTFPRMLLYDPAVNAVDGETLTVDVPGVGSFTLEFDDDFSTILPPPPIPIGATPELTAANIAAVLNLAFPMSPPFAEVAQASNAILLRSDTGSLSPYIIRSNSQMLLAESVNLLFCEGFTHSYQLTWTLTNASVGDTLTIAGYVFEFGGGPPNIAVPILVTPHATILALAAIITSHITDYIAVPNMVAQTLTLIPRSAESKPLTIVFASALFSGVTPDNWGWFFGEDTSRPPAMTLAAAIDMVKAAGVHVELQNPPPLTGCQVSRASMVEKPRGALYYY